MCLMDVNQMQVLEIKKHRWIESEKAKRDLGKDAELDWIRRFAADFRRWVDSCCSEAK